MFMTENGYIMSNKIVFGPGDLNEQLMVEIIKYFKANERWESEDIDRPGVDARNALGVIRILARKRRMEIQRQRKERKKRLKDAKGDQK
jgi:hypothetical protein